MENRIIELEKKSAFQEETIEQLSQALIEQQKRMDALEKLVKSLHSQVQTGAFIKRPDEEVPPPHY